MTKFISTEVIRKLVLGAGIVMAATAADAHHSYAIYDIDNKTERLGVLKEFNYIQPHITMVVESTCDDGRIETWEIATLAPRLWERDGHDVNFAEIGETITIIGWAARNGSKSMALSAIIAEKTGFMELRDSVNQRGARDDLPESTISPDDCQ